MTFKVLAAVAAALFISTGAQAQGTSVTLQPADPPRWDIAGQVGWFGGNKSEIAPDWNDWYDTVLVGASLGYYATPHLKVDAEVFTTATGDIFTQDQLPPLPGEVYPVFRSRQLYFRQTGVSLGVIYQFLDNTWFHPFIGGGLEAVRESSRIETPFQYVPPRAPGPPTVIAGGVNERDSAIHARPFISAGFKWYVTPRAFVRSDIRSSWSTNHAESVVWRGGVGFDF